MRSIVPIVATMLALSATPARADVPPPDLLKIIAGRLEGRVLTPPPKTSIAFAAEAVAASEACGLVPHAMTLSRGSFARSYSVLLDKNAGTPRNLFATVNRVTVDADGSARAYHPEDPEGAGICSKAAGPDGRTKLDGVCALDKFSSGRLYLFRGADKLQKPDLAPAYAEIWPLIRDRVLKSISLSALVPDAPKNYHFFHWREKNLTAFFKRSIIPLTNDGYPCVHDRNSRAPGYFVAATTLTHEGRPVRADGCAPAHYIDAEEVPFFVLPGGPLGEMKIGDVVIARMKAGGADRLAFGIAADIGPIHNFGEASIAFNQALLGKTGEIAMNVRDVWALDIANKPVNVLVLGGTRHLFRGDYSRANVEAVARAAFARWGGPDPLRRLDACAAAAKANPAR
jgi:hypothetical protein